MIDHIEAQARALAAVIQRALTREGYRVELPPDCMAEVLGVQEGRLVLGIHCKAFKVTPPTKPV